MTDLHTRPPRPGSRRKPILVAVAVVVVIGVAVGLALFQPWKIFTRSTVDEALPVAVTAAAGSVPEQMTDGVSAPAAVPAPASVSAPAADPAAAGAPAPAAPAP